MLIPDHAQLIRIMSGQDQSPAAKRWRFALSAMRPGYVAALHLNRAWTLPRRRSLRLPTVSLGNITTGGTGKTPMTIEVVRRLMEMGHRPAVLLRGYGTSDLEAKQNSDEVEVLRNALPPEVPVEPNPNRIKAAKQVRRRHPEVTCFVLDDAFQHRRAKRDLNLVLIDATRPFGFGHILPRGLLREPLKALGRADATIITRADQVTAPELADLIIRIQGLHGQKPVAHAAHTWTSLRLGAKTYPVEALKTMAVFGVCGIGNPETFEKQLREHAHKVVGMGVYDDHHQYTRAELAAVFAAARERDSAAVVTTEKDWVKWRKRASRVRLPIPVYRPRVAMTFTQGSDALDELLRQYIPAPAHNAAT